MPDGSDGRRVISPANSTQNATSDSKLDSDGQVFEHPNQFCPQCASRLQSHRCKMVCPRCGYFMSCSEFE